MNDLNNEMKEIVQATKEWPLSTCKECKYIDGCDPLGECNFISPECCRE